jgi:hypothetical protein
MDWENDVMGSIMNEGKHAQSDCVARDPMIVDVAEKLIHNWNSLLRRHKFGDVTKKTVPILYCPWCGSPLKIGTPPPKDVDKRAFVPSYSMTLAFRAFYRRLVRYDAMVEPATTDDQRKIDLAWKSVEASAITAATHAGSELGLAPESRESR